MALESGLSVDGLAVTDGISFATLSWHGSGPIDHFEIVRTQIGSCGECDVRVVLARDARTSEFLDDMLPRERHGYVFVYEVRGIAACATPPCAASPWARVAYEPPSAIALDRTRDLTQTTLNVLLENRSSAPVGDYESILLGVRASDEPHENDHAGSLVLAGDEAGRAWYYFRWPTQRQLSDFRAHTSGDVGTEWCSLAGPLGVTTSCVFQPTSEPLRPGTRAVVRVTLSPAETPPALHGAWFVVG